MKIQCPQCKHEWQQSSPQHVAAGKARAEAAAKKRMEKFLKRQSREKKA